MFSEDLNDVTVLAILGALGIVGYLLYDWYHNGDAGPTDQVGQTNSLLGAVQGTNSLDPATGTSNGIINNFDNWLFPESNPGGGEVAGSAETATGATSAFWSDPFGALKAIF